MSLGCRWKRWLSQTALVVCLLTPFPTLATAVSSFETSQAAATVAIAQRYMAGYHLPSVILRVTVDEKEIVTDAIGTSADNQPTTTIMHFRSGAASISYIATILLRLVHEKAVVLDAPVATWLPELPYSDQVMLRMLLNMTSDYPHYMQTQEFGRENAAGLNRQGTPHELMDLGLSTKRIFAPGINWDHPHINHIIIDRALDRNTGKPLAVLMREKILQPLHLHDTHGFSTPLIQRLVLHAYTSERRKQSKVSPNQPFYEESTYWNPSWTVAQGGSIQTTDHYDMTATADAIGNGLLLSAQSHAKQVSPKLLGFGKPEQNCPACRTRDTACSYGLGVVISGSWLLQNPLLGGYGAPEAYLPSQKLAIAVAWHLPRGPSLTPATTSTASRQRRSCQISPR